MKKAERELRREIIARCKEMNVNGINQGTSGNISARFEDRMLISPSATPYDQLEPDMIASMALEETSGAWEGPLKPSTEWRFHHALLRERPDAAAVVHAHPTYCTTLAIAQMEIPACHYMIAAFGGNNVRCAGYARFGTEELSAMAVEAMRDRTACLMANHGMIAIGESLAKAMWRAVELETIARQYFLSLQLQRHVILTDEQVDETIAAFKGYGVQDAPDTTAARRPKAARKGAGAKRTRAA